MDELQKLLENAGLKESALDWAGRKTKTRTTNGKPSSEEAPNWANYWAQTSNGAWHWLEKDGPMSTDDSDRFFPKSGRTEFSGYMGDPTGWEHSMAPIGDGQMNESEDSDGADPGMAVSIMSQSCATIMRFGAEGLVHAAIDSSDVYDERIVGVKFNESGSIFVDIQAFADGEGISVSVMVEGSQVKSNPSQIEGNW